MSWTNEEFKVEAFNVEVRAPRHEVGVDTWGSRSFPLSGDGTELHWAKDGLPTKTTVTVTVKNYCKWYELYLVYPDGGVEAVDFPDCGNYEELGSPYVDHVPNPRHVFAWALALDYTVDDAGLTAMCAEWDELRKEWAGLEGYEIHPVDTLGADWREKVASHIIQKIQDNSDESG